MRADGFYLGTHMISQPWFDLGVPLFVSRRRLIRRTALPVARASWALDSGAFTEVSQNGRWVTTEDEYVADVERFLEIGHLDWVAPMDWMCEPEVIAGDPSKGWPGTGLSVVEHQFRTVESFVSLRERLGTLVVPVLQGWTLDDYWRCWELYAEAGVDLAAENTVGLGSVCRRQNTAEAGRIVRALAETGVQLHGFGVKLTGLESFSDVLASADSMAWSYDARNAPPLNGCTHASCANCPRYATRWRLNLLERLGQLRLEVT